MTITLRGTVLFKSSTSLGVDLTSGLILFLAAGLAAQAAACLVQADLISTLGRALWDTSAWLPEESLAGRLLHVLVGYVAQPDGVQLLFYFITLTIIFVIMRICP